MSEVPVAVLSGRPRHPASVRVECKTWRASGASRPRCRRCEQALIRAQDGRAVQLRSGAPPFLNTLDSRSFPASPQVVSKCMPTGGVYSARAAFSLALLLFPRPVQGGGKPWRERARSLDWTGLITAPGLSTDQFGNRDSPGARELLAELPLVVPG